MSTSQWMPHLRRVLALFLCLLLLPSTSPAQAAATKPLTISFSITTYQNRAREVLEQINVLRKEKNLVPLVMPADLEKVAVQRAAELFVFFDHNRPNGTGYDSADDAYTSINNPIAVAEVSAAGYKNADDLMADWSKNALDSLLDPDFTHAGIACIYLKGSFNEYYWVLYLQQQPANFSATHANATAKSGKTKSMLVDIAPTMYASADSSHKRFELKVNNMNLKTKRSADASVFLYDRFGVKIGKCDPSGLTFKSSNRNVFHVLQSGTINRKKAGTATLTISASGLDDAKCTVTISSNNARESSHSASNTAVTANTIGDRKPTLSATPYAKHTSVSVYVKGASGYVLYRATSKTGSYTKIDEQGTTKRWTLTVDKDDITRTYYYKVRAYKNVNGRRVYSKYSSAVKITP